MKLIIDKKGNAGFDEWFDKSDVDKIIEVLNRIGFGIKKEFVEYEFKPEPRLKKREIYDPINWNPERIFLILQNQDKNDDEILKLLNVNRESSYIITTRSRTIIQEYTKFKKLDHPEKWKTEEEMMKAFANYYASAMVKTDNKIAKEIEQMDKDGCRRLEDKQSRFPECLDRFNTNCLTCQFNRNHIHNETDIMRFNIVLDREFVDD